MACKQWNDEWVARIYDELPEEQTQACDAHLESCADCRETMDGLRESRALLQDCAPAVPSAPRLVVLRPRASWVPAWGFAAGVACAAIAFSLGYALSPGSATPAQDPESSLAEATLIPQLRGQLASFEQRIAELEQRDPAAGLPADEQNHLTQNQLQQELERIQRAREDDLDYFMRSLTAAELRTDTRFSHTQEALNLLALRQDPRIRER